MIFEFLEEHGEISEALRQKIKNETSEVVLKDWLKIATKIRSIDEFVMKIG